MNSWIDLSTLIILLLLAVNGGCQGWVRSFCGPVSFVLSLVIAVTVFAATKKLLLAFVCLLAGSFLLTWGLQTLLRELAGIRDEKPTPASRLGGAVINLLWGSSILTVLFALLVFLPFSRLGLDRLQDDMNQSLTYRLMARVITGKTPTPKTSGQARAVARSSCFTGLCNMSEEEKTALGNDPDIAALQKDPRIQVIAEDDGLETAIKRNDFAAVLSNPHIKALMNDPAFMVRALKSFPKIKQAVGE